MLRDAGHKVYVPHEHGVWEDLVPKFKSRDETRQYLYKLDLNAMRNADTCVCCCGDREHPRAPSEGAIWEMGWMKGNNKTVILFNDEGYWDYNLMLQFGADFVFENFDDVLRFLDDEEPR